MLPRPTNKSMLASIEIGDRYFRFLNECINEAMNRILNNEFTRQPNYFMNKKIALCQLKKNSKEYLTIIGTV